MKNAPVLKIDDMRQEVFVKGKRVHLSPKEYRLLHALHKSRRTLSRVQLLEHICGGDESFEKDTRTVDQHVSHIRRKLKKLTPVALIATVVTFGYRYDG